MNSFLNRVMAPGLRRAGSGFAFPQKAEPAIVAPVKAEPAIEEIVEEQPVAPTASPHSWDEAEGREGIEVGSREEKPSPSMSNEPDEIQAGEHAPAPEILFPPPSPERSPLLAEELSFRPAPAGLPPTGEEEPKRAAKILSFETVEFNPAAPYPSMRRFQPSGEKGRVGEDSDRSEPAGPDRTAVREIVWEVVPTDQTVSRQKENDRQKTLRPQGERSEPPISDRRQPSSSSARPSQAARKEEHRPGPLTQSQAAPIRPREATLPRPGVQPKEEKGDLIIEQLEVRVVTEPERRPEPPKARPAAPKRSGAWETAARYYLGKV